MSQTDNKVKYNRPMSSEETRKVWKHGITFIGIALLFMGISFLLVHYDAIKLYPSSMTPKNVEGFSGRVEYTLRYQTLLVAWLMFNVMATIYGRFTNAALNPLYSSSEELMQAHKSILTNSFEQTLLSVFAQLIFVSFASPESVLKFIPLVNILQFIGRIAFFVGYPLKRAFGFQCTAAPTIVLVVYDIVKFIAFVFNL